MLTSGIKAGLLDNLLPLLLGVVMIMLFSPLILCYLAVVAAATPLPVVNAVERP